MQDLTTSRQKLNAIDARMKELYLERMQIIKEVTAYKKANGIATYDPKRESEMKERLSEGISDELKAYYLEFLETVLKTSKDFQDA